MKYYLGTGEGGSEGWFVYYALVEVIVSYLLEISWKPETLSAAWLKRFWLMLSLCFFSLAGARVIWLSSCQLGRTKIVSVMIIPAPRSSFYNSLYLPAVEVPGNPQLWMGQLRPWMTQYNSTVFQYGSAHNSVITVMTIKALLSIYFQDRYFQISGWKITKNCKNSRSVSQIVAVCRGLRL